MKRISKFINEISGDEFYSKEKAQKSEGRSKDIKNAFAFYLNDKKKPKDGNDGVGVQRTEEFYNKLIDTLIVMVKKYEKWIAKEYAKSGGLSRLNVRGYSFLGRYLGDGGSDLYYWWSIQSCTCPHCFKEYGQTYHALNCKCQKKES